MTRTGHVVLKQSTAPEGARFPSSRAEVTRLCAQEKPILMVRTPEGVLVPYVKPRGLFRRIFDFFYPEV